MINQHLVVGDEVSCLGELVVQWFSPYGKKVDGFTLIQDLSEWRSGFSNTTAGKKHQTNVLYCKLATLEPKSVELQKLQLVLNGIILALLPARISILNSFSFFLNTVLNNTVSPQYYGTMIF